jgi:RNA-directed DNA polymerase
MSETSEANPRQFPQGINEREKPTPNKAEPSSRMRWTWAEPAAWTERMLTALEQGVKGGKWYCLMDKVFSMRNLHASFTKVKAKRGAPGADHVTVRRFEERLDANVERLAKQLAAGTYTPQPVKRVYISKPGSEEKRPLGIPTVRDRVIQGALRHVLEPIFERDFAEHSYGFRPGRGCKDALRRVNDLLNNGRTIVVDADIKGYFDSIPHDRLLARVREKVTDRSVLGLVEKFLTQGVLDGLKYWTPEEGTPQGAVLSPLLANIYLDPLDHLMAERGFEMVRYADDFVVLCKSEAEACQALERIRDWTARAGLTLHPGKTRMVDAAERGGFDFLGYHFERGWKWPRKKSLKKLKETIRSKTKRCNGHSLSAIITQINPVLRGWFEYFKHSHKNTFRPLDQWVRMRLRSILRKRRKGEGRGRGTDHQRWPNAYFAEHGLFSLVAAHASACQSARR